MLSDDDKALDDRTTPVARYTVGPSCDASQKPREALLVLALVKAKPGSSGLGPQIEYDQWQLK